LSLRSFLHLRSEEDSGPDVTGRKMRRARNILENSGFFVIVRKKTSEEPPGTVLAMSPKPGSKLEAGDLVRLTIAKAAPAPKPAPEPADCHQSYEGACLNPNASDYDCAGGSGNGPEYTGFVTVVGPDVFGLDADGDGLGCE
jgi:PASTA domain-containing protein